eukprot:2952700-Amphidinium_carterae.1
MTLGWAPPSGCHWVGCYCDDLALISVCQHVRPGGTDHAKEDALALDRRAEKGYSAARFVIKREKCESGLQEAVVWGSQLALQQERGSWMSYREDRLYRSRDLAFDSSAWHSYEASGNYSGAMGPCSTSLPMRSLPAQPLLPVAPTVGGDQEAGRGLASKSTR